MSVRPLAALAAAVLLLLAGSASVLAEDPAGDPRCADWEQNGAPAGIDMRLVCTATEVIGTYTGTEGSHRDLLPLAGVAVASGVALAVVAWAVVMQLTRRAGRRLAPAAPASWWMCPRCHSLNAAGTPACYACRDAAPADADDPAARMPTAPEPVIDQRFGRPPG
jgi:hypothetical protein